MDHSKGISYRQLSVLVKPVYQYDPVGVPGAASVAQSQCPCGGPGGCISSSEPVPLWGSRGLHQSFRASALVGVQGVESLRESTPVGVPGAASVVQGQHLCGGQGGCTIMGQHPL